MLLTHLAKKFIAYMKLKVHFHAHKGQHLELILHQINSVHTILLISLTSTFISSFHLQCLSLSSNLFSSDFSTKTLELFFKFPIQVTSSYHIILLDFISIQIYGKQYKFRRFPTLLQASFFFWHYNPWWTLASSKIVLHILRSCDLYLQSLTPICFRSSSTDSSHLNLGFPTHRVPSGLSIVSFLHGSSSWILKMCISHLNLPIFITLSMSCSL